MKNLSAQQKMWWALVALGVAFAPVVIDYAGVMVALPTIQKSLSLTHNEMHWVVDAYLLSLTCFVVLAGKLGSYFSPRNLFLSGMLLFSVTSVCCAVAQTPMMLLLSRFCQGLAGAMVVSMQGLLLLQIFPENLLGRANGIRVMIACTFMMLSPLLGGFFSEYLSWRYIFWLNLPITAFGFYLGWRLFPDKKPKITSMSIDFLGFFLSTIVVVSLTVGVMQSIDWGWASLRTVTMFVMAVVCAYLFIFVEKRQKNPFIDISILKQTNFRAANLLILSVRTISIMGVFIAVFFQLAWGRSPFVAGLMMLPATLGVVLMGPVAGVMVDYLGPRKTLTVSSVFVIIGTSGIMVGALLHHYAIMVPFMFINAAGTSTIVSNAAIISLTYVNETQRPTASGVSSFVRQFGALVGMTMFSTVISHMTLRHSYTIAFVTAVSIAAMTSFFVLFCATRLSKERVHVN